MHSVLEAVKRPLERREMEGIRFDIRSLFIIIMQQLELLNVI